MSVFQMVAVFLRSLLHTQTELAEVRVSDSLHDGRCARRALRDQGHMREEQRDRDKCINGLIEMTGGGSGADLAAQEVSRRGFAGLQGAILGCLVRLAAGVVEID